MKAVVFTLDAIFALIIAAAGISVLLYFNYATQTPYLVKYNEASSLIKQLSTTPVGAVAGNSNLSWTMLEQGTLETWDQELNNAGNSAGNPAATKRLFVSFVFQAASKITNGSILADYGAVYFTAGGTIYSINPYTGNLIWSKSNVDNVDYDALSQGEFIYANAFALTAISASRGSKIWSVQFQSLGQPTTPLKVYKGEVLVGLLNPNPTVAAYNVKNGTLDWVFRNPNPSPPINSLAAANGSIVVSNGTGIAYITDLDSNTIKGVSSPPLQAAIWRITPSSPILSSGPISTGVAAYGNVIAFGSGGYAILVGQDGAQIAKTFVDGTSAVVSGPGLSIGVSGVAAYNGSVIFQGSYNVVSLNANGGGTNWAQRVGVPSPCCFATRIAFVNATPVVSNGRVYTLWQPFIGARGLPPDFAIQSASTGAVLVAPSILPLFPGISPTTDPYMAIGYGNLFISSGTAVVALGQCNLDPASTILVALATLYVNGGQGCANYILDKITPPGNYTFYVGNAVLQAAMNSSNGFAITETGASIPDLTKTPATIVDWIKPIDPGGPGSGLIYFNFWQGGIDLSNGCVGAYITGAVPDGFLIHSTMTGSNDLLGHGQLNGKPFPYNSWYQIAITYNGIGSAARQIYVNGQFVAQVTGGTFCDYSTTGQQIAIGGPYATGAPGAITYMANFQTYNTMLTANQVQALYRGGLYGNPIPGNLLSWYFLAGDTNDYGALKNNTAFPDPLSRNLFSSVQYLPPGFNNAGQVSTSSVTLSLLNYTTGKYQLYKVGVYTWH